MNDKILWAVVIRATMGGNQRDNFGNLIVETHTIHVLTEKGYTVAVVKALDWLEGWVGREVISVTSVGNVVVSA